MNSMPATLTLNLNYACRISHVLLVYYIQGEVQSRSHKIESMIQDFEEKESLLLRKIAGLELAKERIEQGAVSDLEQLRIELTQLQKQNEELRQQGSELRSEGNTQGMLQSEAEHLREVDEKHEKRSKEQTQNARGENVDERVLLLETELVEAIEAKNMYKVQLQSAIAQQHNGQDAVQQGIGNVDQLIELQKRTKSLEAELRDMQDRYSSMSLRFAKVEAQCEELVMVVRNLRST
ncbi:hypothetical protein CY35_08G084800 [Sphagnum magellanicum]|nr:hypothetical protein CY35_08G084800 [Sphagnum magellanicum]